MTEIKKIEAYFDKSQILSSNKYSNDRDILATILDDKNNYKLEQVDDMLIKFKKRQVV